MKQGETYMLNPIPPHPKIVVNACRGVLCHLFLFQPLMQQMKVLYDHGLYWKETTVRAHISQQKNSEQHNAHLHKYMCIGQTLPELRSNYVHVGARAKRSKMYSLGLEH